jgi:hypothetical protein
MRLDLNLGYSLTETQRVMRRRYHRARSRSARLVPGSTNSRPLSTYSRLRLAGIRFFRPETLIRSHTFHHQQIYRFHVHQAKLEFLTQGTALPAAHNLADITSLKKYLASIETHFPHHLFLSTGVPINGPPLLEVYRRPAASHCQEGQSCHAHGGSCVAHIAEQQETVLSNSRSEPRLR